MTEQQTPKLNCLDITLWGMFIVVIINQMTEIKQIR